MDLPTFIVGRVDTAYFDRKAHHLDLEEKRRRAQVAAAAAALIVHRNRGRDSKKADGRVEDASAWRLAGRQFGLRRR